MFTLNVRKLFRNTFGSWQSAESPRRNARATFKPWLEVLEDRRLLSGGGPDAVTTADLWVSKSSQDWTVGANWSAGVPPSTALGALFDPNATSNGKQGTNTPCVIPSGQNLPIIPGLTINNWSGTLTLNSDLPASSIVINPRTTNAGKDEVIIDQGSNLFALQSLTWAGGNVSGNGNFEVGGTADTINGTSAQDQPTLGCRMDVGTTYLSQYYAGNLVFSANSQPLVVNTNANIYVNDSSSLLFNNVAAPDQNYATAISNGDTYPHSIIVDGGTLTRTNLCQLYVATGLQVDSGQVTVLNPNGQQSGNPLHFTGTNYDGSGLETNGGTVSIKADLQADYQGIFNGGTTSVRAGATLTLGVNANSEASQLKNGTFVLMGTLVPHGGFTISGGIFGTGGSTTSTVNLDAGNQFSLEGGGIAVSQSLVDPFTAPGKLTINGAFNSTGGNLLILVDSVNGVCGLFVVNGAVSGTVTIDTYDVNVNAHAKRNWTLFTASSAANPTAPKVNWDFPAGWDSVPPQNSGGYWQMAVTENQ